jgi:hypothetical protein
MWGNWGTKPCSFAEYCSRDSGNVFIRLKVGKERIFQGFLSAIDRIWIII